MKVVMAHNHYQQAGGEDVVVRQETALLREAGHVVVPYERSNNEADAFQGLARVQLAAETIWSSRTHREFSALLRRERPDVVHTHNTFLRISPALFDACAESGVPVVQTLHNYRLFCPAHSFWRGGHPCEECVEHSLLRSVSHRCYRHSAAATATVATMLSVERLRDGRREKVSRYIALTEFARSKFAACGLPEARLVVKPNFLHRDPGARSTLGPSALFLGRLSEEKGVATLLAAWRRLPAGMTLRIAGDGPQAAALRTMARAWGLSNVRFLGALPRGQALCELASARFLVFPSEWYESFPMTLVEAFAHGVPVLASRLGVMPEIVEEGVSGRLFAAGDAAALAELIASVWKDEAQLRALGQGARMTYEARYTARENLRQLLAIYEAALAGPKESNVGVAA